MRQLMRDIGEKPDSSSMLTRKTAYARIGSPEQLFDVAYRQMLDKQENAKPQPNDRRFDRKTQRGKGAGRVRDASSGEWVPADDHGNDEE